jgi:hypothetical protein
MQIERGGLVGPKGRFVRINPAERGRGLFGGYPVHIDADSPDGDAEFELSQPDAFFTATHVTTGQILGMDATQYSENVCTQYYTLAPEKRGGYESLLGVKLPSGTVLMLIEYTDPRPFISAPLVWVPK